MPPRQPRRRLAALKAQGALHPHADKVTDPLFHESVFFDPHDVVQVKYEMLRRVRDESASVSDTAPAFGFSRPAFYQARDAFQRDGLPGLLPRKRGPRGPHKLTEDVLQALASQRRRDGSTPSTSELAAHLDTAFGISAHPRSIERSLARYRARQEKKR